MEEKWKQILEQSLAGLHFGSVEIVVHNGQITQIEKRERFRAQTDTPPISAGAAVLPARKTVSNQ